MLKVKFTGLCALVPTDNDTFTVVVPNLRNGGDAHGHGIPPHAAYIRMPVTSEISPLPDFASAVRFSNFLVHNKLDAKYKLRHVVLLDGETIEFVTAKPPAGNLKAQLKEVTAMKELVADASFDLTMIGGAKSSQRPYDPDPERVSALIRLSYGELVSADLSEDVSDFRPNAKNRHSGKFAQAVEWRSGAQGLFTINSMRFGAGGKGKTPVPIWEIDATNEIEIEVGCVPLEDLVEPASPRVIRRDHDRIDHHFHAFFGMLATPSAHHPLPHRVSALKRSTRASGANCPPTVFE